MQHAVRGARPLRFGAFELDLQAAELRKAGLRIKLQDQPFQILTMLLEHPGEVVAREELRQKLWPNGTFVDFEHSLNTAIKKLREALGDDADSPRFIETVPRRGYKFIAPVDGATPQPILLPAAVTAARAARRVRPGTVIAAALLLALAIGGTLTWWFWPQTAARTTASRQLTFGAIPMGPAPRGGHFFPAIVTDGKRVYFSAAGYRTHRLAYASVGGGEAVFPPLPLAFAEVRHISPDGSLLLVYGAIEGEAKPSLWLVPTSGGAPRRLADTAGHDGAWSPDGRTLVYASGQDSYMAQPDGAKGQKFLTTPGRAFWIRWSPDGRRLRFTLVDPKTSAQTLWECTSDGENLRRLPLAWEKQPQECCGEWTPDGKYFLFRIFRDFEDNRADIWLVRENGGRKSLTPRRLTTGPIHFIAAALSPDGKKLFASGGVTEIESLTYDPRIRLTAPFMPGLSVGSAGFTRDGEWVAYVEVRTKQTVLWRSKRDGSQRLQLTTPPLLVDAPVWSPDAKQIAFWGKPSAEEPWSIYLVPANGGNHRALLTDGRNALDANWSPDGRSIMFGRPPDYLAEPGASKSIHIIDVLSGEITTLPGSEGLFSPRWSPDGRYVTAMPLDESKLMLFNFSTQKWTELASVPVANPQWSPDGEYVYFNSHHGKVLRVRRRDPKLEQVLDLNTINPSAIGCHFGAVHPDGKLLIGCGTPRFDLYALDLDLP